MTKQIVYKILQELGGKSIPSQEVNFHAIKIYALIHYPEIVEDRYIHTAIGRLRHWKIIEWNNKKHTYRIIDKLEEPNIHSSPITEKDLIAEQ